MDELKHKYEQTIEELHKNASSDKQSVENELKSWIVTLEKQIEDI